MRGLPTGYLAAAFWANHMMTMAFARTGFWRRDAADDNDATLRESFWRKLGAVFAQIPFAEDLLTAYYCAFDRATPSSVKVALLGALAYFVLPFDGIPDILPLIGFTDDAAVLAAALKLMTSHIRPEHRDAARDRLAAMRRTPEHTPDA